jgi:cytochrome c
MALTIVRRVALPICLMLAFIGQATAQDDVERGRGLVTKLCGDCHAVGRTGASPDGKAPTFRSLDDHTDLDEFMDRLRQGQQSTHPDRPAFRFSRDDASAAVAYLRSVQGP